jgi:spermidine synthase
MARRVFLVVYCLSGATALLYQVAWSRLLTLYMGHTVAAVGTVLAAFMGGLAVGAAVAGRVAPRLSRQRALAWYAQLEVLIGLCAFVLPFGLSALQPLLRVAYADGSGSWFGLVRVLSSLLLIGAPAAAMGATFPLAVHWLVGHAPRAARDAGVLYAVNTLGAAFGAAATGFVLLPALGLRLTTLVGVTINIVAAAVSFRLSASVPASSVAKPGPRKGALKVSARVMPPPWLAAAALGLSGFVALVYEVVWTRALALVIGPTTYAFTTMLVAFIVGIAGGSAVASRIVHRVHRPALWLASSLVLAALAAAGASVGLGQVPVAIAGIVSAPDATLPSVIAREAVLIAVLLLPMTIALGAAFPFAVAVAARHPERVAADVARIYTFNTVGAIGGALASSFLLVPLAGLQRSIVLGAILLIAAGALIACAATARVAPRAAMVAAGFGLAAAVLWLPSWNSNLISSGAYKYATDSIAGDLQASLEAGELLYYGEGAAATVGVRRVAGTTSLAIDGKVDASNGADMLTQKLLAHLPLMLHPSPRDVAVIGLGSGVTVGAALQHPITRIDALEISPEVVAASALFYKENHDALSDPRTRLVVADGRTHLMLSERKYDVIISEPSNPWMAGIAALFTREFFEAARSRLRPGGVLCQWAHTYDISDADLRSIVATFASVFPGGAMWLVGEGDLLLIGADTPVVDLLHNVEQAWQRHGVAADLGSVGVRDAFGVLSLFLAGAAGLKEYGSGPIQRDDRLALEFSAPNGIYGARGRQNVETLRRLAATPPPPAIAATLASATATMWRNVGLMHLDAKAGDAAYHALARAVENDADDEKALTGLARAAAATRREQAARAILEHIAQREPGNVPARLALSRLLASQGQSDAALKAAADSLQIDPSSAVAREQLASIFADAGDGARLERVVQVMQRDHPDRPGTLYYSAVLQFLRGAFAEAAAEGERAAAADPSNARVHNLLGAAFANLGDRDRARAALEAAVQADPRDPSALTNLGMFEVESSNPRAAAGRFSEALLLDPEYAPARDGLADALERQGETERAARGGCVRRP